MGLLWYEGGAGGGKVVPMEEMNLHFTGDFHAITSAQFTFCHDR